eukprot:482698_1
MAAGGSAPELFTAIVATFIATSDIGFGTIIGSAVFNVLFVIGLCAVGSGKVLHLGWWPLARDSSYYSISLFVLVYVVWDQYVQAWEAIMLFVMYFGYCIFMYHNEKLENFVKRKRTVSQTTLHLVPQDTAATEESGDGSVDAPVQRSQIYVNESDNNVISAVADCEGEPEHNATLPGCLDSEVEPKNVAADTPEGHNVDITSSSAKELENLDHELDDLGEEEDEEDEPEDPFEWPESTRARVIKVMELPIIFCLYKTIPDCRKEHLEKYYKVTFAMSLVWIAFFTWFMVWMFTEIGLTIGIPDPVNGLTFIAAGTSVPDAISSLIVAKQGYGDMAVSSSIGSNIFDILVGLPIPWLLHGLIIGPVFIQSQTLVLSVLILLLMVVAVIVTIHLNNWRLTPRLGFVMVVLYVIFLVVSLLLENEVIPNIRVRQNV